jgi:hypothetical protein
MNHTDNVNRGNGRNHRNHSKKHSKLLMSVLWNVNSECQGAKNMWKTSHSNRDFTLSVSVSNDF